MQPTITITEKTFGRMRQHSHPALSRQLSSSGAVKIGKTLKKVFLALIALTIGLANIDAAFARNAGVVKNTYRMIEKDYARLQVIAQQLEGFPVKSEYCLPPHSRTKAAALDHLAAIYAKRTSPASGYRGRRTSLHNFVLADGLGGALEEVAPGGTEAIRDGTFWNKYENVLSMIDSFYARKEAAIKAARSKRCAGGTPAPSVAPVDKPAIAIADPLTGIQTDLTFKDVDVPNSQPDKFCHQDEKDQYLYHLRQLRFDARQNAVKASRLEQALREKLAELVTARNKAFQTADAAAKAHDPKLGELNSQYQTAKSEADVAQSSFPALILKAEADRRKWQGVVDAIDEAIKKANAIPVIDCSADAETGNPLNATGFPDVYKNVDNISLVDFELLTIDITRTCFQEVKDAYVMRASTELSHARTNLSRWQERLHQVGGHHDLLSHDANASADLVEEMRKARIEARNEVAKWTRIVAQAEAVKAKADATIVEDCSGDGGKTEIGRLDPGFSNISSEIPMPGLQAYDLPEIPARICTWEELEALRARAAKAREVSAHNRSEWGKRLVALGNMLFRGENRQAYPLTPEYAAYLDAQRQVDYWSVQQEVSHKRFYELVNRDVDDCSEPEKKVSMGMGPSVPTGVKTSGGNNRDGSRLGALQDAIDNRPVINGGKSGGFGDPFNPLGGGIIDQGGCLYPDPRLDGIHCRPNGSAGFDGSEAERDLHETLKGVESHHNPHGQDESGQDDNHAGSPQPGYNDGHVHTPYCDHGQPGDRQNPWTPETAVEKELATPTDLPSTDGRDDRVAPGFHTGVGSVDLTPNPTGPTPIPYPNTGRELDVGSNAAKIGGDGSVVLRNQPSRSGVTYSGGKASEPVDQLKKGEAGPTGYAIPDPFASGRETPTLNIPAGETLSRGTMIQVAPPSLVIDNRGQSVRTPTDAEAAAALELQTGN